MVSKEEKIAFLDKQRTSYGVMMYQCEVNIRIAKRLDDKKMEEAHKKNMERAQMAIDVIDEELKTLNEKK